ncbi:MAG: protease pro-enzyme activation domain-containing protein [Solirubrobacteraceae bacterium]
MKVCGRIHVGWTGVAVAATVAAALSVAGPAAAIASKQVRLGAAPLQPAGARVLGALPGGTQLSVLVALKPRDPVALANYATAVSTPGSSVYRRYLTVAGFRARFGPTAGQIAMVQASLRGAGLQGGRVSPNGLTIPVSASADALAHAFSTSFHQVRLRSGRVAFANVQSPSLDTAVAGLVQGVIGLDDLVQPHPLLMGRPAGRASAGHAASSLETSPRVVTGGPQPCSTAAAAAPGQDAYTSDEVASMYNFSSLYGAGDEGAGETVALFELEPNIHSDVTAFQSCYGTSATVNYIAEDGGPTGSAPGRDDAGLETELDIEDVIGLAPDATIDVYQAPNSNTGLIDNYTAMVDNASVQVISTSWGECESESGSSILSEEGTLFEQAATEGQSVFAAAGDDGSTDCVTSSLAVDDPASQPYVTGVGGTTSTTDTAPPSQTVWNDSSNQTGAGGGGISSIHAMPAYQAGAAASLNVINSHSSGTPCGAASGSYCREVPDVSANADPYTGYLVYYDRSWIGIGGTSGAAPLWAALTALTNASASCAGKPIGFANPALYDAAAGGYSSDFFDVTSGNNDYTPDGYAGGLYPAGSGYDMASGLGTPNGANLPAALCAGGAAGDTVTVTNPGAQAGTVGVGVSLQVLASDSASGQTLSYSATGLPAGLSISSSGLITGAPTATGSSSVTVTAKDTTGASGSASFTWTVNPSSSCTSAQLLLNPGFESGALDWQATGSVILNNSQTEPSEQAQAGSWFAWLGGYAGQHTDTLAQTVTVPAACTSATLTYYQHIDTTERKSRGAVDTLKLQVLSPSGTTLATLSSYSNRNAAQGYHLITVKLGNYAGKTITISWTGTDTGKGGGTTDFCIDTTALNVTAAASSTRTEPKTHRKRSGQHSKRPGHHRTAGPSHKRRKHSGRHRHGS